MTDYKIKEKQIEELKKLLEGIREQITSVNEDENEMIAAEGGGDSIDIAGPIHEVLDEPLRQLKFLLEDIENQPETEPAAAAELAELKERLRWRDPTIEDPDDYDGLYFEALVNISSHYNLKIHYIRPMSLKKICHILDNERKMYEYSIPGISYAKENIIKWRPQILPEGFDDGTDN